MYVYSILILVRIHLPIKCYFNLILAKWVLDSACIPFYGGDQLLRRNMARTSHVLMVGIYLNSDISGFRSCLGYPISTVF